MRIDLVPDGMPELPLPDLLRAAAELRIATLEFGCGNWPSTPHLKRGALLDSVAARNDFLAQLPARPVDKCTELFGHHAASQRAWHADRKASARTVRLAGLLGIPRIVTMSDCDGSPDSRSDQWKTVRSCRW